MAIASSSSTMRGSSPLTRGKRRKNQFSLPSPGLIPAHAGKTHPESRRPTGSRAHPRSRGENPKHAANPTPEYGSSPLTRGKREGEGADRVDRRLIPAHAGKTACVDAPGLDERAHPRSRGENAACRFAQGLAQGSSPLTRGKPAGRVTSSCTLGLIPAHAGKTLSAHQFLVPSWAHPRSRGENAPNEGYEAKVSGSSPLTRGKRRPHAVRSF